MGFLQTLILVFPLLATSSPPHPSLRTLSEQTILLRVSQQDQWRRIELIAFIFICVVNEYSQENCFRSFFTLVVVLIQGCYLKYMRNVVILD